MRARAGTILGWSALVVYAALLTWVTAQALRDPDLDRTASSPEQAAAHLVVAWQRSREATFVTTGTYERHSEVTGATIASEDVLAQRPPRRLHRQLGGVEGRDDDRLIVCPAPPAGAEDERAPCLLGPPAGTTYVESVAREVEGIRSLTHGDDPLYVVREPQPGCFELELARVDPRAPFGVAGSFCFDAATGAPTSRRVRHAGGISEVLVVTSVESDVSDADLEP
jgi:hypothetical protein